VALVAYSLHYGTGVVAEADSQGYRDFAPYRTLGYPLVLWLANKLGVVAVLGSLQLAVLLAAVLYAWNVPMGRKPWLRWVFLAAVIANPEFIKHGFREMSDALFAAAVLWHVAACLKLLSGENATSVKGRGILALVAISGICAIWLRPAGLPLLLATSITVFIHLSPRRAICLVLGLAFGGWFIPSSLNLAARGYFATQEFGGLLVLNTATPAIATLQLEKLPADERQLYQAIVPAARLINGASWPFGQAMMATLSSEYLLQSGFPELYAKAPPSKDIAKKRTGIAYALVGKAIANAPLDYFRIYTANVASLMAAPGLLTRTEAKAINDDIAALGPRDGALRQSATKVLKPVRVFPLWGIAPIRIIGIIGFLLAIVAAFIQMARLGQRMAGRKIALGQWNGVLYLGIGLSGYLGLLALVNAVPRLMMDVWPLGVLFGLSGLGVLWSNRQKE
jgi:hypothetical protein